MNAPRHLATSRCLLTILLLPALPPAIAAAPAAPPALDAANVAAWADETFTQALAQHQFSGATVSVVKDGALIFSKGYGRADYSRPGPVDPARTQFRIGSITKTFTATMIAQLVDEGRIASLDDPANTYLRDYRLPDNGGVPITLRHLLTHTAGFEDQFFFIGADSPISTHPPARVFDSLRPAYVRPAGARVEYSNFGVAVLGRIVEDLTGLGIAQAMQQRLFGPLGMSHTLLMDDLGEPAALGRPATILPDGSYRPTQFTAISPPIAAAGSIATTADDMARYMLAQLGESLDPTAGQAPVLNRAVLERLHTRLAGNAPDATGLAMVFFLDDWAGTQTVAHGGNWTGFHSWMTLIPAQRAGIFVSLMSEAPGPTVGSDLRKLVLPWTTPSASPAVLSGNVYVKSFLTRFLGERRALPDATRSDNHALAGRYRFDRRPFTTAEAVGDLVYLGAGTLAISATPAGLEIAGAGPWRPAGNGAFVLDAPTRDRAIVREDPRVGAPVLIPDLGIYTATRIGWYQHPLLHVRMALAALLIGCIALGLLHRGRARPVPRIARLLAWITVIAGVSLLPLALYGRADGASMLEALYAGHTGRLIAFVVAAHVLLIAALGTLAVSLMSRGGARRSRALLAVGVCGVAISAILAVYNVIGWHVPG
ncbi:MAG: D-aminopeptidase [Steroidobacteraceae bacterium]|nr:D-aminopeptidase [Steroidobacteraceae bacterium]